MSPAQRRETIQRLAAEFGFARAGVASVGPVPRQAYVEAWLDAGMAGEMTYLHRHKDLRADPQLLLPGAHSVIVVADNYRQPEGTTSTTAADDRATPRGRIARYAWGRDYHRVLRKKLQRMADRLRETLGEPFESRVCVDTAPLIEREWAAAAGVGWIGKNTMVLHQDVGSFFFLGEILTSLAIEPTLAVADRCGTCTRCLDACPTGAFIAPYQMDARRCISYLTIEHRGEIVPKLQPLMGDWLYGCDICQEVCPYNRKPTITSETAYFAGHRNPLPPATPLQCVDNMSPKDYDSWLSGSAMRRASREMLQRNAAIVRQNHDNKKARP